VAIDTKDVQELRRSTGAGVLDCKRALEAAGGDLAKAAAWLREQGLVQSAKRAERESAQGAVAVANLASGAAVVALQCETDFVAKSDDFVNLAGDLAHLVAEKGEEAASELAGDVERLRLALKENIVVGQVVRFEAADGTVLDTYLHVQNDRGVNGVLVEVAGAGAELAHDVALHIAHMRPRWIGRDEVPPERVEAERAVLETLTRNEGKPEAAVPKIVEGRLRGFFGQPGVALLDQPFVKDAKRTVGAVLGDASVTRFAQVEIGG